MVTFIIGGQPYEASTLTFKQLKRCWPDVQDTLKHINGPKLEGEDAVQRGFASVETACKIVAVALEKTHPDMTAEKIEDSLYPKEANDLSAAMQELMIEAGLVTSGPQMPAGGSVVSPSTATGTQSSPSSLPPELKADAGTE